MSASSRPSSAVISLSAGINIAHISRVGACLDRLAIAGTELVQQFPQDAPRPYSAGVLLAPWPNRIRDGRWTQDGNAYELAITDNARHNAIHGLVTDGTFDVLHQTDSSVTLEYLIGPAAGYPFSVTVTVSYQLSDQGLECAMSLRNEGVDNAPVALGAHPYLTIGDAPIRSLTIEGPVVSQLVTDTQMIPVAEEAIAGSKVDISSRVSLEKLELDTGFRLGGDAPYTTTLAANNGKEVSLWQSKEFGWLQVFVTDEFPGPDGPTSAVAIEPMTAPANAFNSGTDLKWLEPGESWGGRWGISLSE